MNNEIEIGTVQLYYDNVGSLLSATFEAAPIDMDKDELIDRLKFTDGTSEEAIRSQTEAILAAWFTRTNRIELADRDNYEIAIETVECERRETDNSIQRCALRIALKEKKHETIHSMVN